MQTARRTTLQEEAGKHRGAAVISRSLPPPSPLLGRATMGRRRLSRTRWGEKGGAAGEGGTMGHLFPPLTLRLRSPEAYGNALRNISKVKKKGAERERGRRRQLNYFFAAKSFLLRLAFSFSTLRRQPCRKEGGSEKVSVGKPKRPISHRIMFSILPFPKERPWQPAAFPPSSSSIRSLSD